MKEKVYDSMKQAAAAEGLPYAWIQTAKDAGCDGFEGSRVRIAPVKKWIAENGAGLTDPNSGGIEDKIKFETWRKLKNKNDRDEGKVVSKAAIAAAVIRILGRVAGFLESKLVNELPSAMAGLDVPQGRVYGRRLFDQIMVFMQSLAKEFPE